MTSTEGVKCHIFRQLFDQESCTYTYLLACSKTKQAILVDPVHTKVERDVKLLGELGLSLKYAVNTHCHADHVTGSGILKTLTGCLSVISKASGAAADVHLQHGEDIVYGEHKVTALATPGHTNGCMTFVSHQERFALTGDALLIRGCGRTDFQEGDSGMLYDSVHSNILSLQCDYRLFPAHDYKGVTMTTVAEEKQYNPRLTKSKEDFVKLMENLGLSYPKKIDVAVPWNMRCGPVQLGQSLELEK